jgi:Ca2+-binding EF-hand superfamily protein
MFIRACRFLIPSSLAIALCACGGPSNIPPGAQMPMQRQQDQEIASLMRYDANGDGKVTRAEMEAGARADFAKADTNGDGKLDQKEWQAENARRYAADGPQTSPLIDWNQDGVISLEEFAGQARSLFDQYDADHNGVVDQDEMRPKIRARSGKPQGQPSSGNGGDNGNGPVPGGS